MNKENIFNKFIKEVCNNCKNKKECQEELRIRLDNSIKCDKYEQKPKGVLISAMRIGE